MFSTKLMTLRLSLIIALPHIAVSFPTGAVQETDLPLFEGDIILNSFDHGLLSSHDLDEKRVVQRNRNYLWRTRVIPYEISSGVAAAEDVIKESFEEIEKVSCLKFVPQTDEMNWIKFESGKGCASYVGKQFFTAGGQSIILDVPCYKKGLIIHEILHAVGFWHEQNRSDRHKYIEIMWENIVAGKEHNFHQFDHFETDNLGTDYDTGSIMHYGNYYFSKNSKMTMASIHDRLKSIGNKRVMSQLDIVRLNALYSCKAVSSGFISEWSDYSPCQSNCVKTRQRFCSHEDLAKCPGVDYNGIETERKQCIRDSTECYAPIDGHWGRWSSWGECSKTCGKGTVTRARYCNNPQPKYGGKNCPGTNIFVSTCISPSCDLGPHDCDFETGELCHWTVIGSKFDDFKWAIHQGGTSSSSTGPQSDATGESGGKYLLVESSSPAMEGDTTQLVSGPFKDIPGMCIDFDFHMFGDDGMGQLNVYQKDRNNGSLTKLWSKNGNQGNQWLNCSIDVNTAGKDFQIVIEAVRGKGYRSDIGIDNIFLSTQTCKFTVGQLQPWMVQLEGCYVSRLPTTSQRVFPHLKDYRPAINWTNVGEMVDKCAQYVQQKTIYNDELFGVEFWGECWYGTRDKTVLSNLVPSNECVSGVGRSDRVAIYEMKRG